MTQPDDPDSARRQFIARFIDDVRIARQSGHHVDDQTLIDSHPELMPELAGELEKLRRIEAARSAAESPPIPPVSVDAPTQDIHIPSALFDDLTQPAPQVPGYSILREISRGGQAVVYLATQLSTSRKVALKLMRDGPFATERAHTRFRREVQALAALNHPNIVAIIDTGKTADGSRYLAMNYIAGANLSDFMRNLYKKDPADPGKLLRTFLKICDAVNAAHQLGIIHRDLKPSNIRVDERGEPHILDFGLARTNLDASTVSVTGEFLGSLPWSSPEQALGDPEKIDARTDIYSLGVILYQILTAGRFPYQVVGNIRDVLNNILNTSPTPPSKITTISQSEKSPAPPPKRPLPAINETIEKIVLKALAKKPELRYQSASDLARDIAKYLAGQRLSTKDRKSQPPPKTNRHLTAYFVLTILLIILAAIALSFHFGTNAPTPPQQIASTEPASTLPSITTPLTPAQPIAPVPLPHAFPGNLHVLFKGGTLELLLNGKSILQSPGDDLRSIPLTLNPGDSLTFRLNSSFYYRSVRAAFLTGDPETSFTLTPENTTLHELTDSTTQPTTQPAPQLGPHDDHQQTLWQSANLPPTAPWLAIPNPNITYDLTFTMPTIKIFATTPDTVITPTPIAPPSAPQPFPPPSAVVTPPAENLAADSHKTDLLKLIDPLQDVLGGTWAFRDGQLICSASNFNEMELPYSPATNYDFRMVFEITNGGKGINIVGRTSRGQYVWCYGMNGIYVGVRDITGFDANDSRNPTAAKGFLNQNQQYTVVLKVRDTSIEAFLDGKLITKVDAATNQIGLPKEFKLRNNNSLGINTKGCDVTITSLEITDINGQGKILRRAPH